MTSAASVLGAGLGVGGMVKHICVIGSNIMWSAEECLPGDAGGVPVGMVYMFDPSNLTVLPIKVWMSCCYSVLILISFLRILILFLYYSYFALVLLFYATRIRGSL